MLLRILATTHAVATDFRPMTSRTNIRVRPVNADRTVTPCVIMTGRAPGDYDETPG